MNWPQRRQDAKKITAVSNRPPMSNRKLAIILAAAVVLSCAGCATPRVPLDQATASAVQKSAPASELARAAERIRALSACPAAEFVPATPLSFLVAAMDAPEADAEKAKLLFRLYRDAGCDIQAPDRAGLRPIHSAILFRNPALAQFLLESGADPALPIEPPSKQSGKSGYEFTELVCAKNAGRCPALKAVLEQWKSRAKRLNPA